MINQKGDFQLPKSLDQTWMINKKKTIPDLKLTFFLINYIILIWKNEYQSNQYIR
jgi:hypothetical protein